MMDKQSINRFFNKCTLNKGASESEISSLQDWVSSRFPGPCAQLPKNYLELLRQTDGLEGFVGESSFLMLWPTSDVQKYNDGYISTRRIPMLLVIGSNGGADAYAFDLRHSPSSIRVVPFIGMDIDESEEVGSDFEAFLERLRTES